ncbi:MAG: glycosyltransferase family 4 protein [Cyanophyceae cyanobacterium]
MRIAYLTGEYPRATDTFIQREVMTLREQGVEVQTFSVRRTGDEHLVGPEQQTERDRTFYILPAHPVALVRAHLLLLLAKPGHYWRALKLAWLTCPDGLLKALYQLFYFAEAGIVAEQMHKQDIEHLHNHLADSSCSVAMLAAELGGFTFSFTIHGPYIFFEPYRWRLDAKIQRALFVSCISHFCRSQCMLFAPPETWNRLHIVHCGIDPSLFTIVTHRQQQGRLLFVGRLAATKGLPVLFDSLAILKQTYPDVILTLVGDGSERAELEAAIARLELTDNVELVGYKSQAEVRQYMQTADVFVLPSFAEGLPVVLMEALAAGVPVVTTRIAGVSELVEEGINGYLVPPGDAGALADKIHKLLSDADLRTRLGKNGRTKVEQEFNLHHEAKWLYQIVTAALQGKEEAIRWE